MSSFRSSTFLFFLFTVFEMTLCMDEKSHGRKCYNIKDNSFCYFLPGTVNVGSGTKWLDAWDLCRSSNATLPIILDEAMQNIFQNYVDSLSIDYAKFSENKVKFWMAGREVRKSEWSWLNGKQFVFPDNQADKDSHLYGTIADYGDLHYSKEYVRQNNHYVCQHFGEACNAAEAIPLKNGCLLINNDCPSDVYDARNNCVRKEGDLAIIDGEEDLRQLAKVFPRIRKSEEMWVGLRRQWWIWNGTNSSEDVKYSNWKDDHGYQTRKECMTSVHRTTNQSRWEQVPCDYSNPFIICQTGPHELILEMEHSQVPAGLASSIKLAISLAVVLIVIIVVVVVVIVVRKKRSAKKDTQKDRGYENLQHRKRERENSGQRPYTNVDLCLPEGFDVDPYHNEAPQLSIRQSQLHGHPDHLYYSIDDYSQITETKTDII